MRGTAAALAIVATILLPSRSGDEASEIKPDERVLLLPGSASLAADGGSWIVPIHGWVFEPESDSRSRELLVTALARSLGLDDDQAQDERFCARAAYFLVDNERGKRVAIRIGGQKLVMPPSEENGHFRGEARIGREVLETSIAVSAVTGPDDMQVATGRIALVGPRGVSVISDIDDTIKKSDVLDKTELLANTFLREPAAVPGMAEAYRRWERAGAAFHYLSSSPWQLYPMLEQFLEDARFPIGAMDLKLFRAKDQSFFDLFASPEKTKPPAIERLMATWPVRRFILVGDSGEKDPEVYGQAARAHPEQVLHVFIRRVDGSDLSEDRLKRAFAGVPSVRWTLFDDPAALAALTWDAPAP